METETERMNKIYAKIGDKAFEIVRNLDLDNDSTEELNKAYFGLERLQKNMSNVDAYRPRKVHLCPDAWKAEQIIDNNQSKIHNTLTLRALEDME